MSAADDDLRGLIEQAEPNDTLGRWDLLRTVEQGLFGGPDQPLVLGRYRIVSKIGGGGQGTVYVAHDPELGRDVAIKVVRSDRRSPEARSRLLREAAALAQLSHPNVVAVNDVGEHEDGVFVVTRLVPGVTLGRWLETARPWQEIVPVFVQAGRGLVAAHAQRIVHRDFKPANVIVTDAGEVQLLDFGLAREMEDAASDGHTTSTSSGGSHGSSTATGHVMGTPVYMAPEQHMGEHATDAADQYAFCVALFEALARRRPFHGDTLGELVLAKQAKDPPAWPRAVDVPARLRRLVERGLARDPGDRWPSMADVVARLEATLRPSRGGWAIGVGALGIGAIAVTVVAIGDPAPSCADPRAFASVWSPERAARITAAYEGSGRAIAKDVAARLVTWTDAYARSWNDARAEACEAVKSDPDADRTIACLDRARIALDETLGVLEGADVAVKIRARDVVAGLPVPARCGTDRRAAPDASIAGEVATARASIAQARAFFGAGRYADATPMLDDVVATAKTLGDPTLLVEAQLAMGSALLGKRAIEPAATTLEQVYLDAEAIGDDASAFASAALLAQLHGADRDDAELGTTWVRRAEVVLARMGDAADPVLGGELERTQADIAQRAGRLDEAIEHGLRAAERLENELGDADPKVARAYRSLAVAYVRVNELDDAEASIARAREIAEAAVGPEHPETASAIRVQGWIMRFRGDFEQSLEIARRAYALQEAALGPDSEQLAITLENIAVLHSEMGHPAEAEAAYRRVLEIHAKTLPPGDGAFARAMHNLAITLRDVGRKDEAIAMWREAMAIAHKSLGADHVETAMFATTFAGLLADEGRIPEASIMIDDALDVLRRKLGEDNVRTAETWGIRSHVRRRARDFASARDSIERALEIMEKAYGPDHLQVGRMLHSHAALLMEEGDPRGALDVHARALAILEAKLGRSHTSVAELLEAMATEHTAVGETALAEQAKARAEAIEAAAGVPPEPD